MALKFAATAIAIRPCTLSSIAMPIDLAQLEKHLITKSYIEG